jgi:hypothetical protein
VDEAKKLKAKPFPPGTTVFAKIGEALRQNRVRQIVRPTLIDNNMMGAIPKTDTVSSDFLYYLLGNFDIASTSNGTALPYITVSVLGNIKFVVPPLDVQRRIADILSAYDDLMELNTRRIAILEEIVRRLYEEWFIKFRFPDHQAATFVQQGSGFVPDKWSTKTLASIADVNSDTISTRSAPRKRGKRPGGKSFGLPALVGCGRSTRADGCRFPWRGISDSIAGCRLPISIHFRLPS